MKAFGIYVGLVGSLVMLYLALVNVEQPPAAFFCLMASGGFFWTVRKLERWEVGS